jgi:hypothetical protein
MKENCLYKVVRKWEVPKNQNIFKDKMIDLGSIMLWENVFFPYGALHSQRKLSAENGDYLSFIYQ